MMHSTYFFRCPCGTPLQSTEPSTICPNCHRQNVTDWPAKYQAVRSDFTPDDPKESK